MRLRWKVSLIAVSALLLSGAVIAHEAQERWKNDPQTKAAYRDLIARQLVTAWECIPPENKQARKEFVLSLMDRFAPDDRGIMETGRSRTQELERKAWAGTLTVEDREKIKTADYFRSQNFSAPSCWEKKAVTPQWWNVEPTWETTGTCAPDHLYMTVRFRIPDRPQDFQIVYEDRFARWELYGSNWRLAVDRELDAQENLEEPWRYQARLDDLKRKAKAQVAAMNAADVPEGTEDGLTETMFRKLVCAEN